MAARAGNDPNGIFLIREPGGEGLDARVRTAAAPAHSVGPDPFGVGGRQWLAWVIIKSYFAYYHRSRTHLSLGKDAPEPRAVQPPSLGKIVALPEVGGLHHRYERRAA